MKIRKQVYELTPADIRKYPVWEYALDEEGDEGQDEATVRPCKVSGPLDPSDRPFMIRASFTLADGTKMLGLLTTPFLGDDGLGSLQPVIVTEHGQVIFWYGGSRPDAQRLKKNYALLERNAAATFPIQVMSDVALVGPPIRTTIPGFLVLVDWRTEKTKTVK